MRCTRYIHYVIKFVSGEVYSIQHYVIKFVSGEVYSIQHYVIKFVSGEVYSIQHYVIKFVSGEVYSIQHYVIKFVSGEVYSKKPYCRQHQKIRSEIDRKKLRTVSSVLLVWFISEVRSHTPPTPLIRNR